MIYNWGSCRQGNPKLQQSFTCSRYRLDFIDWQLAWYHWLHVSHTIPLSSHVTGLSQVPHGYNESDVDGPGFMLTSFDSVSRNIERYVRVTFGPFLGQKPLRWLWFVITVATTYSWSVYTRLISIMLIFFSVIALQQQSSNIHAGSFWYIILILSQPVFRRSKKHPF